jgi:hypothetical protein
MVSTPLLSDHVAFGPQVPLAAEAVKLKGAIDRSIATASSTLMSLFVFFIGFPPLYVNAKSNTNIHILFYHTCFPFTTIDNVKICFSDLYKINNITSLKVFSL